MNKRYESSFATGIHNRLSAKTKLSICARIGRWEDVQNLEKSRLDPPHGKSVPVIYGAGCGSDGLTLRPNTMGKKAFRPEGSTNRSQRFS